MEGCLKAPRNLQRFSCMIDVVAMHENNHDGTDENVIRIATTSGRNLLSISISPEIGQHITSTSSQATASITIDGSVITIYDDEFQPIDQGGAVPLDQLVAAAVSPDMLEDEPGARTMLSMFRTRLLKSLEVVKQAIASLPKD
jgi:hypothetical protein